MRHSTDSSLCLVLVAPGESQKYHKSNIQKLIHHVNYNCLHLLKLADYYIGNDCRAVADLSSDFKLCGDLN